MGTPIATANVATTGATKIVPNTVPTTIRFLLSAKVPYLNSNYLLNCKFSIHFKAVDIDFAKIRIVLLGFAETQFLYMQKE
ncbi:hypothetical protein BpHYR1_042512 [Brachionus plicatilis]|uniref:Uncharacterized protein n=1 Tax=Brachionus plicatilis TaxID=10195 RepID=A0A3M7SXH1_BRAPC|nr:hypothetical protein BpHYR1_042512 [Brachionus plicatilis]